MKQPLAISALIALLALSLATQAMASMVSTAPDPTAMEEPVTVDGAPLGATVWLRDSSGIYKKGPPWIALQPPFPLQPPYAADSLGNIHEWSATPWLINREGSVTATGEYHHYRCSTSRCKWIVQPVRITLSDYHLCGASHAVWTYRTLEFVGGAFRKSYPLHCTGAILPPLRSLGATERQQTVRNQPKAIRPVM